MDNKSKKELLNELETSKKVIKELKTTLHNNEEFNRELLKNERLLSQSALELVDSKADEDLYEFTALKMEKLYPDSLILVTSYDKKTDLFGMVSIKGLDQKKISLLNRFLGENFMEVKVGFNDFDEILQKCLFTHTFKELPRGLYAASGQVFPQKVCKLLEKLIGVKKTYGMGLLWDDNLYGAVSVFSRGESILDKKEIVETLVNMVSVALQKRNAEDEIKKALEQKELLMKEIHHRTKNNLSVISSLLNLQSLYITDQNALKVLKESQDRAKCMGLIHEGLCTSNDLKNIDFKEYIHNLTLNLFRSYLDECQHIKLNSHIEDTMLDIDTAVPLGLVVNELVTNSIKYAFPRGKSGEINLEFYKNDNQFVLGISDNGIGLPDDFNLENVNSMGLQIVNRLISQIDGQIEMHNSMGTKCTVKFREPDYVL